MSDEGLCRDARINWGVAKPGYENTVADGKSLATSLENDAVYLERQRAVRDDLNRKLTYLNEQIDAKNRKISDLQAIIDSSSSTQQERDEAGAEVKTLESELRGLDDNYDGRQPTKTRRDELATEIETIEGRLPGNRDELNRLKDEAAQFYTALENAKASIDANCSEEHRGSSEFWMPERWP